MTIHIYNVINAANEVIRQIKIGKKDIKIASKKVRFLYGDNSVFLRLEYKGIE